MTGEPPDRHCGLCTEPWPRSPFPHRLSSSSQELNNRLAAEITRLRTLLTGEGGGEAAGSPLTQGKDAYELEVSSAAPMGQHWWAQVTEDPREHATAIHPSTHWVSLAVSTVHQGVQWGQELLGAFIFPSHPVEPHTCSSPSLSCPLGSSPHKVVGTNRNRGVRREHISGASLGKVPQNPGVIFLHEPAVLQCWCGASTGLSFQLWLSCHRAQWMSISGLHCVRSGVNMCCLCSHRSCCGSKNQKSST